MSKEIATFGAGCFWHVEEYFRKINGVINTKVGYMGGKTKNPTYEEVCSDKTHHIEVCQVMYDNKKINYGELLKIFFNIHNPTQYKRQGPDVGNQYSSIIFYHNDEQKKLAEKTIKETQKDYKEKIATEVIKAKEFWKAEGYHQKYLMKRGLDSCSI